MTYFYLLKFKIENYHILKNLQNSKCLLNLGLKFNFKIMSPDSPSEKGVSRRFFLRRAPVQAAATAVAAHKAVTATAAALGGAVLVACEKVKVLDCKTDDLKLGSSDKTPPSMDELLANILWGDEE